MTEYLWNAFVENGLTPNQPTLKQPNGTSNSNDWQRGDGDV
jgi:hypothetical protein